MKKRSAIPGFTLIEVLIALTVLALSAMAVVSQTGQSLNQLNQLQQKTIALAIAENQLNRLQLGDNWPGIGRSDTQLSYANQRWYIESDISNTSDPWLRKIEISVSSEALGKDYPLVSLIGYRGRY